MKYKIFDEEKIFNYEEVDVLLTEIASEKVLAKDWLTKDEDEAWKDL